MCLYGQGQGQLWRASESLIGETKFEISQVGKNSLDKQIDVG